MPEVSNNTCGALLPDGDTRCAVPLLFRKYSCDAHAAAYDASYERYKEAERKADRLAEPARMRRVDVQRLRLHEIAPCINRVRAYADALAEELRLRREHDIQFIRIPDAGHRQRLENLERQIVYHRGILQALRTRRRRSQHHNGRTTSPSPHIVQRRIGPKPEEERKARTRAEARRHWQLSEEQERQHLVVAEAERKRQQRVDEEAFRRDLQAAILRSCVVQHDEKDGQRSERAGESSGGRAELDGERMREDCRKGVVTDGAGDCLEDCLPTEDPSGEVAGRVDTSGDDTASDRTLNNSESLDYPEFPIRQLHELPCISVLVGDDCNSSNSASSTIDVEELETAQLARIIIPKGELVANPSEDSSVTTLVSEPQGGPLALMPPDTTWPDNLSSSQPAPEAVGSEIVILVNVTDDGHTHVRFAETPVGAAYDQNCRDAIEEIGDEAGRGGKSDGEGRPRRGGHGRGRRYLKYLLSAVFQVVAFVVLRKMYRANAIGKLWKLLKRIAHVGAGRVSN
ncbi:hypothetical protein LXA43DRAFT_1101677 [Ganoderma leucocontextum]|nr:hypothetical protein LXA43DRAFT_1101677 [Ganoderma leucocontextum]